MTRRVLALAVAAILAAAVGGGVKAGGGGGGGGVTKIKFTGYINAMVPTADGVLVTVGTSYYNTGTSLATPNTKIKINGVSVPFEAIGVGDYAEITAEWPSRLAIKIEVIR